MKKFDELKKLSLVFTLIIMVSIGGLMSCSDDDDDGGDKTPDDTTAVDDGKLAVNLTTGTVNIDGDGSDAAWADATEKTFTFGETGYTKDFGEIPVKVKALYDTENIYFLMEWTDPSNTESVMKKEWSYDETSSEWTQSGVDEDRFFFMFDAGNNGAEGADCASMCHFDPSQDKSVMGTTGGGNVDVWHWKAARTNPIGLSDDKWWDGEAKDGRKSDAKTIGAYMDNKNAEGTGPMWSGPINEDGFIILGEGQTTENLTLFDENSATDQTYPGYVLNMNADGSRWADVYAKGAFNNGVWTLEFKRELNTGNADDVAFDIDKEIQATMAVTDNDGHIHSGVAPFLIKFVK